MIEVCKKMIDKKTKAGNCFIFFQNFYQNGTFYSPLRPVTCYGKKTKGLSPPQQGQPTACRMVLIQAQPAPLPPLPVSLVTTFVEINKNSLLLPHFPIATIDGIKRQKEQNPSYARTRALNAHVRLCNHKCKFFCKENFYSGYRFYSLKRKASFLIALYLCTRFLK